MDLLSDNTEPYEIILRAKVGTHIKFNNIMLRRYAKINNKNERPYNRVRLPIPVNLNDSRTKAIRYEYNNVTIPYYDIWHFDLLFVTKRKRKST